MIKPDTAPVTYSHTTHLSETVPLQPRTGVLLVNLGTPDSPSVPDVRKYLREFLMDGRVIDIPFLSRALLINLVIAPFRAPKSAKVYKQVWTERGSPLKFYSEEATQLLQEKLGSAYLVKLAMRYQNPGIESVLNELKIRDYNNSLSFRFFRSMLLPVQVLFTKK